jgi:putative addiction module killer protein
MEIDPIVVEEYLTVQGVSPFGRWLDDLNDLRAQTKIDARLARVRAGNFGDSKSVGGGVYELRIDYGPGYRVYFARSEKTVVLLLLGGDKSTQRSDILKSQTYWQDYLKRKEDANE